MKDLLITVLHSVPQNSRGSNYPVKLVYVEFLLQILHCGLLNQGVLGVVGGRHGNQSKASFSFLAIFCKRWSRVQNKAVSANAAEARRWVSI